MNKLFLYFFILISLVSISTALNIGSDSRDIGVVIADPSIVNYSIVNTNSSDFWDGLDTPLDSWLSTFNQTYQDGIPYWYNHTSSVLDLLDEEFIYNHTSTVYDLWNVIWRTTFNQTYHDKALEEEKRYATIPRPESIVGYWQFNGNNVDDSSPNKNDGTVSGATHVHEHYEFDGVDDYIDVSSYKPKNDSMTWAAWIYPKQIKVTNQFAISNHNGGGDGSAQGFDIRTYSTNVYCQLANVSKYRILATSAILSVNNWYHIGCVYDNSTTTLSLYVNGALKQSKAVGGGPWASSNYGATIGSLRNPSPSSYFNGTIDEVLIYNRSLSSTEISDLYNDGLYHTVDFDFKYQNQPYTINDLLIYDGNVNITKNITANNYYSSDGSQGITEEIVLNTTCILSFKDGLLVGGCL